MRRAEPGHVRTNEDEHWRPLKENGANGEALETPRLDDVVDAEREVNKKEGAEEYRDPDLAHIKSRGYRLGQIVGDSGSVFYDGCRPNLGTVRGRQEHENCGNDQTLFTVTSVIVFGDRRAEKRTCRTIEVPQVESVRMVGFPGGKEHRKARYKSGKCACLGCAIS